MSDYKEFSDSGSPILRHTREKDFELAYANEDSIKKISDHIEKYIGKIARVYHEIISDMVHIDIHCVEPTPDRNFYTLVTSGMSDKEMIVPQELETYRFAELMICLPASWPISDEDFKDENNYWPIRWLKTLAWLPHKFDTWLGFGHTIPNGDPEKPYAPNTKFSSMLVSLPQTVKNFEEFFELKINDIKRIRFYSLLPIYKEETAFKLKYGAEALLQRFDEHGISDVMELKRKSVCKKTFWPFRI